MKPHHLPLRLGATVLYHEATSFTNKKYLHRWEMLVPCSNVTWYKKDVTIGPVLHTAERVLGYITSLHRTTIHKFLWSSQR